MRKVIVLGVAAVLGASCLAAGYASATPPDHATTPIQVVTHDNEKDWKIDAVNGIVSFDAAEGCDAPSHTGDGALHLTVSPGDGHARLRNGLYNNTPLADLTALNYWACDVNNNGQQFPFLMLDVDWDGDHVTDDIIFFEPTYQNPTDGGACGALSAQQSPQEHMWQYWDALRGNTGADSNACWWSVNDPTFMPGTVIRPLSQYVMQHPDATIVNPDGNFGGVQVAHGDASPSDAFDGYVDTLNIADGNTNSGVTYDFEPSH